MEQFFNVRYEFDIDRIHSLIEERSKNDRGYICVADGVILSLVQRNTVYRKVIDEAMFSICDSGWVPTYIKWIYGLDRKQYCGCEIFEDIIRMRRYHMLFLGTNQQTLCSLRKNLASLDSRIEEMRFEELPYCAVDQFDYATIGETINRYAPDIIWVALGAPKQELFMHYLQPHIRRGVMIAVGAVFNFYSGEKIRRAPQWMIRWKMEFIHRIWCEPRKQWQRCRQIIHVLPSMLYKAFRSRGKMNPTYQS